MSRKYTDIEFQVLRSQSTEYWTKQKVNQNKEYNDKIKELLNMNDPITKKNYMSYGDCSEVGLCEILLDQTIRKNGGIGLNCFR